MKNYLKNNNVVFEGIINGDNYTAYKNCTIKINDTIYTPDTVEKNGVVLNNTGTENHCDIPDTPNSRISRSIQIGSPILSFLGALYGLRKILKKNRERASEEPQEGNNNDRTQGESTVASSSETRPAGPDLENQLPRLSSQSAGAGNQRTRKTSPNKKRSSSKTRKNGSSL